MDPDPDKNGKKSDHRIVVARPINKINNKTSRETRKVKVRPFTKSGYEKMQKWFIDQSWEDVFKAETAHAKASTFQELLLNILDVYFPEKNKKH